PLALAVVEQRARSEALTQTVQQLRGHEPLFRAERRDIPLGAVHVVNRDECWFATHGEADVTSMNLLVDLVAERFDALPLRLGVGQGDARVLVNSADRDLVRELDFTVIHRAGDRRGRRRLRGGGYGDVSLPGEQ